MIGSEVCNEVRISLDLLKKSIGDMEATTETLATIVETIASLEGSKRELSAIASNAATIPSCGDGSNCGELKSVFDWIKSAENDRSFIGDVLALIDEALDCLGKMRDSVASSMSKHNKIEG